MNPPTPEAVQQAFDILVASGYEVNFGLAQVKSEMHSLVDINTRIKMLKTAIRAFDAKAQAELTRLSRRQNSLIPIHANVPDEILIQILSEAFSRESWRDDLHRIAGVCKLWQSIILESPKFWAHIDETYPEEVVKIYLRRSRPAPLDISYNEDGLRSTMQDRFADLVAADGHLHRWRSLRLSGNYGLDALILTAIKAPKLRELELGHMLESLLDLPLVPASLRILNLRRVIVRRLTFENLQHLILLDVHYLSSSAQTFENELTLLHALEVLVLQSITLQLQHPPPEPWIEKSGPKAFFPSLKILYITNAPLILSSFVPRIHAPALHHATVGEFPSQSFDFPHSPLIQSLQHLVDSAFDLELSVFPAARTILLRVVEPCSRSRFKRDCPAVDDYRPGAWVSIPCHGGVMIAYERLVNTLSSAITEATPIHLFFNGETDSLINVILHPVEATIPTFPLSLLPGVDTIKIKGPLVAEPLLQYLGGSSTDADGKASWPCPRLSRLDLSEWNGFEMTRVEELVTRRWGTMGDPVSESKAKQLDRLLLPPRAMHYAYRVLHAACKVTSHQND